MKKVFPAEVGSIRPVTEYIIEALKEYRTNDKLCKEYELLIEELATKLVLCAGKDSELTVQVNRRFGKISAKIRCPGTQVSLESESNTDFSGQILEEYSECLKQSYTFGTNEIAFTSSSSSNTILLKNVISLALAVITGLLLKLLLGDARLDWIDSNIASPVTSIFIRALQTVAAPVAFFSLASFVITIKRTYDRNNKTIHLCAKYIITSIIAIFIGIVSWKMFSGLLTGFDLSRFKISENDFIGVTVKDFLAQIVSTNIVEPFLITNPIPMLINALLMGLAASSLFGKYGDTARNLIYALNDLFARFLSIIYNTIPYFLFFAVVDCILNLGPDSLKFIALILGSAFSSMILLLVFYGLRLLIGGINPIRFLVDNIEIILENLSIGSNIDALPYNKRRLARKTVLSRDHLYEGLKLGTLMNMDGNCLTVTIIIAELISSAGISLSLEKYIGMAIILFLFSVGAPNQPGSLMLGIVLLMSYIGISEYILCTVIVFEAILSKFYSFLNAAGDIVTMAIEDSRLRRQDLQKK